MLMALNIYELSDDYQDKLTDTILKEFKDTVEEVLVTEEDLYDRMLRLWNDPYREIEIALEEPGELWKELNSFIDPDYDYFEAEVASRGEMDRIVLAKILCSNEMSDDPEVFHCVQFVWLP